MLIVFEGHDLSGKTLLAQTLAKELNKCFYIKNFHKPLAPKEEQLCKLRYSYEQLFDFFFQLSNSPLKDSHVILDRFFISEFVYSQLFRGYDSENDPNFQRIQHRLKQYTSNAVKTRQSLLVIVEISDQAIIERKNRRGEDFNLYQIQLIREKYREYLTTSNFSHTLLLENHEDQFRGNIETLKRLIG